MNELYKIIGESNIYIEELMAKHTTFRIGGNAQIFVTPNTVEEIGQILQLCKASRIPYFILGNGSNLLVSDEGMDGVVIQLYHNFSGYRICGNQVNAQAGVMLSQLGNALKESELTGFEFAAGIPGTVGGAIMMNAGAYGGEMKDIVQSVQLMDLDGNILEKTVDEMEFSYRHSIVEENQYVVLGATLLLNKGNKKDIEEKMQALALARRTKQPLEYPSAGSTFKRPEGYFAGKLIMDAGLSGYQVGGAKVSEKHCGFVVNVGNATANDVKQLIAQVQKVVYDQFHVAIEPEIRLVGRKRN